MKSIWTLLVSVFILNLTSAQILFTTETPAEVDGQTTCKTPDGNGGQCIYLQNCKKLYDLLTKNPRTDEETTYLRRSQCGNHGGDVRVCCPIGRPNVQTPTPSRIDPALRGDVLPQPGVCGTGSAVRIVGGNRTAIDEFPWMALLQYSKPGNVKGFHCGGVLINYRYVLTAAHCVNGREIPKDWRLSSVRLGEWDTSTVKDCDGELCSEPPLDIVIEKFRTHENYDPRSKNQENDIALLRLSRSVPYTVWITPICLPTAPRFRNSNFAGMILEVAGWGRTETASRSTIKLKASVSGIELAGCNRVYKKSGHDIKDTHICAGGQSGIDSCTGDSGGPLMAMDKNHSKPHFFLAGIVSFGTVGCGVEGWPGIYTKVGRYVDWIQRNIEP